MHCVRLITIYTITYHHQNIAKGSIDSRAECSHPLSTFWSHHKLIKIRFQKGAHPCGALRSRVGAKGCWRHFFKNPTTQLRVDWVLTEKKCEQTPKFACFSVQRRPLHLSQAEMLPSHAVLKEGIK